MALRVVNNILIINHTVVTHVPIICACVKAPLQVILTCCGALRLL